MSVKSYISLMTEIVRELLTHGLPQGLINMNESYTGSIIVKLLLFRHLLTLND